MKCRNCGAPKQDHVPIAGPHGRKVWRCPNGSGNSFPAMAEVKIELRYRPGDDRPWHASWYDPAMGPGEVTSTHAADALEAAATAIDRALEEKTPDQKAIEDAIKER